MWAFVALTPNSIAFPTHDCKGVLAENCRTPGFRLGCPKAHCLPPASPHHPPLSPATAAPAGGCSTSLPCVSPLTLGDGNRQTQALEGQAPTRFPPSSAPASAVLSAAEGACTPILKSPNSSVSWYASVRFQKKAEGGNPAFRRSSAAILRLYAISHSVGVRSRSVCTFSHT